MARGMWRWWEDKDGADKWWAHIEYVPGEWGDVDVAQYESAGYQPPFWDLPLKEDYFGGLAMRDPQFEFAQLERKVMPWAIIGMIILAGVLFVVAVVATILLVKLHLYR